MFHRLKRSPNSALSAWLALWAGLCAGWLFVIYLLWIPTDSQNQLPLELSTKRLALIIIALGLLGIHSALAWAGWRYPNKQFRYLLNLFSVCAVITSLLWVGISVIKLLPRNDIIRLAIQTYYQRSLPFLFWLTLETLLLLAALQVFDTQAHRFDWRKAKRSWLAGAILLTLLLLIGALATLTGIGISPDKVGWGGPAVPILIDQAILATLVSLAFSAMLLLLTKVWRERPQSAWLDFVICILLWFAAWLIWSSQPVPRSYFTLTSVAPNYEIYPASDASLYSLASQSLQLGYGFSSGSVTPRPLYILLLAIFHAIAGQSYENIVFVQTLVLATFPALLYLLGKSLHSRTLGVMVAILAIIREMNAFSATSMLEVSHSKLLLADFPTALAIVLLTLFIVRWFKMPFASRFDPLLAGGFLGIASLIRTQSLILLPVIVFCMLWVYRRHRKRLFTAIFTLLVGLSLVVSPWIYRNWKVSGQLTFDDPSQSKMVLLRYRIEMEAFYPPLPGESDSEYAVRLESMLGPFILSQPLVVTKFILAHFINNEIASINILPQCLGLNTFTRTLEKCPSFLHPLSGNTFVNGITLFTNLILMILGLVTSWKEWKIAGLFPAFLHLAYNLGNALARNSARRYILPVDWIAYFYFSVGVIELLRWLSRSLRARHELIPKTSSVNPNHMSVVPGSHFSNWKGTLVASCLLIIGLSLPLSEILILPKYPVQSQQQLIQTILALPVVSELSLEPDSLSKFVQQESVVAIQGRALYPRFYLPLKGEEYKEHPAYRPYEYRPTSKLGFLVMTPNGENDVNLAIDTPIYFPNASDVIVLGCKETDTNGYAYIDALLVIVTSDQDRTILRSKMDSLTCPLK